MAATYVWKTKVLGDSNYNIQFHLQLRYFPEEPIRRTLGLIKTVHTVANQIC